jgi:hypothetical protein
MRRVCLREYVHGPRFVRFLCTGCLVGGVRFVIVMVFNVLLGARSLE